MIKTIEYTMECLKELELLRCEGYTYYTKLLGSSDVVKWYKTERHANAAVLKSISVEGARPLSLVRITTPINTILDIYHNADSVDAVEVSKAVADTTMKACNIVLPPNWDKNTRSNRYNPNVTIKARLLGAGDRALYRISKHLIDLRKVSTNRHVQLNLIKASLYRHIVRALAADNLAIDSSNLYWVLEYCVDKGSDAVVCESAYNRWEHVELVKAQYPDKLKATLKACYQTIIHEEGTITS